MKQRPQHPKAGRFSRKFLAVFCLLALVCLLDLAFEANSIRVREYVIRDSDVPAAFAGYRIVFLTDIHYGPYFLKHRMNDLVKQVNELKPDLVLLGGDYISRGAEYLAPCFEGLGRIRAADGVHGVLGNHDHWVGAARCREQMTAHGIEVIDNRGFWIIRGRSRIKVGGVGDLTENIQILEPTTADALEKDFVALVSHHPDFAERIDSRKIDLMLAGHTHGGQVTFFGLYAPLLPTSTGQRYRSGLVKTPFLDVIVSNGIGVITPPVRFCAPPEIVMARLEPE